jgi:hypothetical protein
MIISVYTHNGMETIKVNFLPSNKVSHPSHHHQKFTSQKTQTRTTVKVIKCSDDKSSITLVHASITTRHVHEIWGLIMFIATQDRQQYKHEISETQNGNKAQW